jgi:hypothetical protein
MNFINGLIAIFYIFAFAFSGRFENLGHEESAAK